MKITEYNNGEEISIQTNSEESKSADRIIKALLSMANDMLRVYLDEETITGIKKENHCIEILYSKTQTYRSDFIGTVTVNRILIPLSGDYSSGKENNSVTIITGENSYSSGPYTTNGGYELIEELQLMLKN